MKKILIIFYLFLGLAFASPNINTGLNIESNYIQMSENNIMRSYKELPNTIHNVKFDVELTTSGNNYIMNFKIPGLTKNTLITTKLPHHDLKDFNRKDNDIYRMQFYTDEDKSRILFYEFNDRNDGTTDYPGFRPFIHLDIETNEINGTDALTLFGNSFQDGTAFYTDILFPMKLDDLLEIHIDYSYRSRYGILGMGIAWGPWKDYRVERYKGNAEAKLKWWEKLLIGTIDMGNISAIDGWIQLGKGDAGKAKHIEQINSKATENYKNDYVKNINNYLSDIGEEKVDKSIFNNDNSLYRVYVDSRYRFSETKYQVKDINVVRVKYIFQGEFFDVLEQDIVSVITKVNSIGSWQNIFDWFKDIGKWINDNWVIIVIVIVVIIALFLLPIIIGGFGAILSLIKLTGNIIKLIFSIPGLVIRFIKWLLIPKKKTQNKGGRKT